MDGHLNWFLENERVKIEREGLSATSRERECGMAGEAREKGPSRAALPAQQLALYPQHGAGHVCASVRKRPTEHPGVSRTEGKPRPGSACPESTGKLAAKLPGTESRKT